MTDSYSYPDRMPSAVRTPMNHEPWVALSHGPDIRTAEVSLDEDYIASLAAACTDADWELMAHLAMSFDTTTPDERPDVATVFRNAAGEVTYSDPTGSLALSTTWHESNEQLASLGAQTANAAERIARFGYDPASPEYQDRPRDDGMRAMPDSGAAARARMVELARESHHGQTVAHHTRSESFNPTTVTTPAAYMHGDGSPVIGRDGMPLWQQRHDVDVEPEFTTTDAAVNAAFDDREALAHQALRNMGLRP